MAIELNRIVSTPMAQTLTILKGVKKTKPKWARKIGILWAAWG